MKFSSPMDFSLEMMDKSDFSNTTFGPDFSSLLITADDTEERGENPWDQSSRVLELEKKKNHAAENTLVIEDLSPFLPPSARFSAFASSSLSFLPPSGPSSSSAAAGVAVRGKEDEYPTEHTTKGFNSDSSEKDFASHFSSHAASSMNVTQHKDPGSVTLLQGNAESLWKAPPPPSPAAPGSADLQQPLFASLFSSYLTPCSSIHSSVGKGTSLSLSSSSSDLSRKQLLVWPPNTHGDRNNNDVKFSCTSTGKGGGGGAGNSSSSSNISSSSNGGGGARTFPGSSSLSSCLSGSLSLHSSSIRFHHHDANPKFSSSAISSSTCTSSSPSGWVSGGESISLLSSSSSSSPASSSQRMKLPTSAATVPRSLRVPPHPSVRVLPSSGVGVGDAYPGAMPMNATTATPTLEVEEEEEMMVVGGGGGGEKEKKKGNVGMGKYASLMRCLTEEEKWTNPDDSFLSSFTEELISPSMRMPSTPPLAPEEKAWVKVLHLRPNTTGVMLMSLFYPHSAEEVQTLRRKNEIIGLVRFWSEEMAHQAAEKMNGCLPPGQTRMLEVIPISLDDVKEEMRLTKEHPVSPLYSMLTDRHLNRLDTAAVLQKMPYLEAARQVTDEVLHADNRTLNRLTRVLASLDKQWEYRYEFGMELYQRLYLQLIESNCRFQSSNCGRILAHLFLTGFLPPDKDPFVFAKDFLVQIGLRVPHVEGICALAHLCSTMDFQLSKASFWAVVREIACNAADDTIRIALLGHLHRYLKYCAQQDVALPESSRHSLSKPLLDDSQAPTGYRVTSSSPPSPSSTLSIPHAEGHIYYQGLNHPNPNMSVGSPSPNANTNHQNMSTSGSSSTGYHSSSTHSLSTGVKPWSTVMTHPTSMAMERPATNTSVPENRSGAPILGAGRDPLGSSAHPYSTSLRGGGGGGDVTAGMPAFSPSSSAAAAADGAGGAGGYQHSFLRDSIPISVLPKEMQGEMEEEEEEEDVYSMMPSSISASTRGLSSSHVGGSHSMSVSGSGGGVNSRHPFSNATWPGTSSPVSSSTSPSGSRLSPCSMGSTSLLGHPEDAKFRTVYISHLPPAVPQSMFMTMLRRCGGVNKVRICAGKGYTTLFSFVEMSTIRGAQEVLKLNGMSYMGFSFRVQTAKNPIQDELKEDAQVDSTTGEIRQECLFGGSTSPLLNAISATDFK